MKKFINKTSMLLAVGMTVGVVTSCSSSSDTTNDTTDTTNTTNEVAESNETTDTGEVEEVVMWGSWSGSQIDQLNQQLEEYNNSQDKYHVVYQVQQQVEEKLLTGIVGGDVPDVILWDRFVTNVYAPKGALMPLDELVAKDNVNLDDFYEPAVEELTYNDQLYGIPLLVDARVIFYNKDLLGDAGLEPPTTWDELAENAKQLSVWEGDKLVQAGFSLSDPGLFSIYMEQAGGKLVSDDNMTVAYNSPEGLEVLNYWDRLLNEDKVYSLGFDDGVDSFAAGTLAMKYDGPWAIDTYDKVDTLNYGIAEPPVGYNGDKGAKMGGFGLVIPSLAQNTDGAWDFIQWWTTQPENGVEFAKISGWLPANKVAANDPYFLENEHYAAFVKTMDYATLRPTVQGFSDVEGLALRPQLERFMSGEITAEEALSIAEKDGNDILADNR